MDYGIKDKKAIVCASSRGLGKGCAIMLARAGARVVINGRNEDTLIAAAEEIKRDTGQEVEIAVGDVTTDEGRAALLRACPNPDILVNNAGGPPPGDFRDWDKQVWIDALNENMLAPIELIKATIDGMIEKGFGRIIHITSSGVKEPIGILGLSNGARTGLTGFIAGLSRDVAAHGVTINNLLPGAFDTDRRNAMIAVGAKNTGRTEEEVRTEQMEQIPVKRFGSIQEFGATCAFLCSDQAGFITGQNIMLDGGAFRSTF